MKRIFFIIIFFLFFLQVSFIPALSESGSTINFLLAGVVSLGLLFNFEAVIGWIFLIGILFESYSANVFGLAMISFLVVGFFVFLIKSFFLSEERQLLINYLVFILSKIVFDLTFWALGFGLHFVFKKQNGYLSDFSVWGYLLEIFWFTIAGILIYEIFSRVKNKFEDDFKEIKV
ncbi:MAG: hypothetical protein R6V40_02450 [Candidatus Moraniibacteriota bacterium]